MMKQWKWLFLLVVSTGVGMWYLYDTTRLMEEYRYFIFTAAVILWLFWKVFVMYKKTRLDNDTQIQIQFVEG